jgi:hypothetical protein
VSDSEEDPVSVRDVRLVERDKPRVSIILAVDHGWCEVVSARGHAGDGPHVFIPVERKEAKILGLTKHTHFRLDNIDWVRREDVKQHMGKRCPPGVMERIRQMQQDAANGVVGRLAY